jgi:hypothetical protein
MSMCVQDMSASDGVSTEWQFAIATHTPHSSSSYHTSLLTSFSTSTSWNVRMTLVVCRRASSLLPCRAWELVWREGPAVGGCSSVERMCPAGGGEVGTAQECERWPSWIVNTYFERKLTGRVPFPSDSPHETSVTDDGAVCRGRRGDRDLRG